MEGERLRYDGESKILDHRDALITPCVVSPQAGNKRLCRIDAPVRMLDAVDYGRVNCIRLHVVPLWGQETKKPRRRKGGTSAGPCNDGLAQRQIDRWALVLNGNRIARTTESIGHVGDGRPFPGRASKLR